MTVNELVKKNEENVNYDYNNHVIHKYIPIEEKQTVASYIVQNSFYVYKDGDRTFFANSTKKYVLTMLKLVDLYTDIERDESDLLGDFNKLNQIGFFEFLDDELDRYSQYEYQEFKAILEAEEEDLFTNEYEPQGFIRHQVERFGNLIGATLYPVIKDLDMEQIGNAIKTAIQKEVE